MKKRPRDPNQLAKLMIDIATGQVKDEGSSAHGRAEAGQRAEGGGSLEAGGSTQPVEPGLAGVSSPAYFKRPDYRDSERLTWSLVS